VSAASNVSKLTKAKPREICVSGSLHINTRDKGLPEKYKQKPKQQRNKTKDIIFESHSIMKKMKRDLPITKYEKLNA
jgi:hypothetical protein